MRRNLQPVLFLVGLLIASLFFLGTASVHAQSPTKKGVGKWSLTGSMQASRAFFTATLLPDGQVLATGSLGYLSSAELYNPSPGMGSNTGSVQDARYAPPATSLRNGQ